MKRAMLILAIAATASAQQSGRQRSIAHPVQLGPDWGIEITTSGGITGGGSGGLIVSSDGALIIAFGSNPSAKRCTFQLTAVELQDLVTAVGNGRPRSWMECYSLADVGTHCCDLIRTNVTLSARNGRDLYMTSWLTGTESLPQDLHRLIELLRGPAGLDSRYRPLCATQ
ncbi:MAG TPA: hypothetical protein VER58_08410 [Thermoanaerobaculia bacterium]|nr:hypothetical protein [Thermoanaerobaculia bacterium]